MKKRPFVIAGIVIVVLILIILSLPLFINANQFRPRIEAALESSLGRNVQIGNISLSIFSGGVTIQDVSISDDPAFSQSAFLQAKDLKAGVNLIPLVFSKKLEVRSFTVDQPVVTLLKSQSGVWNFASLGRGAAANAPAANATGTTPAANETSSTADFSVQKLKIANGKIIVSTPRSKARPSVYENVNVDVSDLSYTSQFPFTLTATGPGGSALKLAGKAGPMDRADASATPLQAKIDIEHLNLASTGFLDPSAGIAGILNFTGDLASDGHQMTSKGTVKAQGLKLASNGSPASVPVDIDYSAQYQMKGQNGLVQQGDVHIGKALARLTGTYDASGQAITVRMKLVGQTMPVSDLEGVLSAVGVTLPSGASLKGGTLDANLTLTGPVDKLDIEGPVNLSNTKLAGFSLGSKLTAIQSFMGHAKSSGSDTDIQTLSMNLRVDPSTTHADNLKLVVPSIGTITGTADVSAAGKLNGKMLAQLANGASNPVGQLTSRFSPLAGGNAQSSGIPFLIEGTTKAPIFLPDAAGMVKGLIKGPTGAASSNPAAGALQGLFGKKKPPR